MKSRRCHVQRARLQTSRHCARRLPFSLLLRRSSLLGYSFHLRPVKSAAKTVGSDLKMRSNSSLKFAPVGRRTPQKRGASQLYVRSQIEKSRCIHLLRIRSFDWRGQLRRRATCSNQWQNRYIAQVAKGCVHIARGGVPSESQLFEDRNGRNGGSLGRRRCGRKSSRSRYARHHQRTMGSCWLWAAHASGIYFYSGWKRGGHTLALLLRSDVTPNTSLHTDALTRARELGR